MVSMEIPTSLYAGDTWTWTDQVSDYPATTYTLKYTLHKYGSDPITLTASASGTDHVTSVAAATSAGYGAGVWDWVATAEITGPPLVKYTVASGQVTIKPSLSAATSSTDNRSHAQTVLDALEAAIEGRASRTELALTMPNGRSIQFMSPREMTVWRSFYRAEVNRERGKTRLIRIQFGDA